MSTPILTETTIRQNASEESFQRGHDYYKQGAVLSLIKRGMMFQAEVEGSEALPYTVHCTLADNGVITATCTCPYDWGGWCKHIVAACLAMIHQPERIEERPTVDALLSKLDREGLQSLLLKLVEREPALADAIEGLVGLPAVTSPATPVASPAAKPPRPIQVDPKAVRRQVQSIMHSLDRMRSSEAYWHAGEVVGEVGQVLEQAWTLIKAGDGRNALVVLEAITEEFLSESESLDDSDGEVSGFFYELDPAWTEALLSTDLSQEEREAWANKLTAWQEGLSNIGVDDVFDAPQTAALLGWDYPPLQRVLQGTITEQGAWDGEVPYYADDLAVARLNILERRERFQEYLYLAEAEGQTEAYVTMLVRLGRTQEAVAYGREYLGTAQEALSLARALYEHGEREEGLQIAERGLTLQGPKAFLAQWLRDEAAAMGEMALALNAAEVTFREELSLANYLRAARLAGEQWPELRSRLLDYARHTTSYVTEGQVDVFLHEGLLDDATAVVGPHTYRGVVEKVVDAAMELRPEWVIQACRQQAEPIMNGAKAEYYSSAANWLAKARTAYRNMHREEEWRMYLNELLARHRRKYKLVPMLEALR